METCQHRNPISNIKLHGRHKRRCADSLLTWHRKCVKPTRATAYDGRPESSSAPATAAPSKITVVCIADTHNKQPLIPPGDILIHAGDLTENGSFDEMQAGLKWLSSHPHRFKVFVAGNHDVLLDEEFLAKYPERRYGQKETKNDLDWGDVIHLRKSSVTLDFSHFSQTTTNYNQPHHDESIIQQQEQQQPAAQTITIYGSPLTPQYGISAFQYPPESPDLWQDQQLSSSHSPTKSPPDILITHGPPKLHLDKRDFHRAGCPYLAVEVARLRPRLHVFGHIHAAYGREDEVVLDGVQRAYEDVMVGWGGWATVARMAALVSFASFKRWVVRGGRPVQGRGTTFVNAAVVGGRNNELVNEPVVVDL